jgi:hypothetical protein
MRVADSQVCLVDELDARQDEVLAQLDVLNQQIEALLAEYNQERGASESDSA